MDTTIITLLLSLIAVLLSVIVAGGWNLITFIKTQLVDNTKEHKLFYNNVMHSSETRTIVNRHTEEIKVLDEKVDKNTMDIDKIKRTRYK